MTLRARVRAVLRSKPKTTYERVRFMLVNELHCDPAHVYDDARLIEELGLDEQDFFDLADAIDHEFGVNFMEFPPMKTVRDLIKEIDNAA